MMIAAASGTCHILALSKAATAASVRAGRLFQAGYPRPGPSLLLAARPSNSPKQSWRRQSSSPCSRSQDYSAKEDSAKEEAALVSGSPEDDEPHIPVLMEEVLSSFRDTKLGVGTPAIPQHTIANSTRDHHMVVTESLLFLFCMVPHGSDGSHPRRLHFH